MKMPKTGDNKILIVGNGPSTRGLVDWDFSDLPSDVDTFGMGVAYRFFRQVNWWPTYYALADSRVVFSHRNALMELVADPTILTQRFYYSWPISDLPRFELIPHSSTGDFCFRKSIELGYKEIYLIGIEGNYVEEIPESRPMTGDEYYQLGFDQLRLSETQKETLRIITRTPTDNPNYFFSGYQEKGDVYSLPQTSKHRDRWAKVAQVAEKKGIKVVNLSENSEISFFPKSTLDDIFVGTHFRNFMKWIKVSSPVLLMMGKFIKWSIRIVSGSPARLIAILFAVAILLALALLPMASPVAWALAVLDACVFLLLLCGLTVSFAKSRVSLFLEAQEKSLESQLQRQWNLSKSNSQHGKALREVNESKLAEVDGLRARLASLEKQMDALCYPNAPTCIVFFGHHKCASRFFRFEVFEQLAEMIGARIRKYEVRNPPFHYSNMDELDLCNIDFSNIGENGRDIILFCNSSLRSLERVQKTASHWKGLRVLRDPRQVLVSNYFHHIGGHTVWAYGWVWDQLEHDKPILRSLPKEEGMLYELENISKQIIEMQLLPKFDDDRIMTIKVEDFNRDPRRFLCEISDFLEVPQLAGIDLGRRFRNPDSGYWRYHFTPKLFDVYKKRYGEALIELGYEKDLDW